MRGAALLALALAGCSAAARDEAPPVQARPTIVSLNPCTDAILAEVADPGQLRAISHYSHDPASASMDPARAQRFAAVGDGVEELVALRPDLVVTGTFIPPATARAITRLGMRLELVSIATDVAASKAQVRHLAALAGHPERGEALVHRIDAALAAAAPPPGTVPVPAVVWQGGGIVPGEGTLIADLLHRTGFSSQSAARGLGQADVLPLENLLADPPRAILAVTRGEEDRMLAHPVLARLTGTRRARLDPALVWCGGPTIPRAAARLGEIRRAPTDPPPTPPASGRGE